VWTVRGIREKIVIGRCLFCLDEENVKTYVVLLYGD